MITRAHVTSAAWTRLGLQRSLRHPPRRCLAAASSHACKPLDLVERPWIDEHTPDNGMWEQVTRSRAAAAIGFRLHEVLGSVLLELGDVPFLDAHLQLLPLCVQGAILRLHLLNAPLQAHQRTS